MKLFFKPTHTKPLRVIFQGLLFGLIISQIIACDNTQTFAQNTSNITNHAYAYSILPQQQKESTISNEFMQIKIHNSIALGKKTFDSIPLSELSGIAWDEDEQLLYAISDEGFLYHFKLGFSDKSKQGKLTSLEVVFATPLKDSSGHALKGKYSDSEGLSLINERNGVKGDSSLIISFENKPRIAQYSPTGRFTLKVDIRKKLHKRRYFRNKNKGLESVTYHPKFGILTAAEYPLKKDDIKFQTLYGAAKGTGKKVWHFKASNAANSAITGLETLQDGSILLLERAYKNPITPIIINLRRLKLDKCDEKQVCETEMLANFNGADGWLLDNFEGLAHLKENQYLMVSDDNGSPLQRTIFVHFEINKAKKHNN